MNFLAGHALPIQPSDPCLRHGSHAVNTEALMLGQSLPGYWQVCGVA